MPRATWSGAISFGMVNIPVKLYTATSRHTVRFNQIDTRTGSRIRQRKVSEATGEEVPAEAIAKGYELSSGQYVIVSEDELAALDPEASRTIDLLEFVDQESIDPIYYDAGYYLAPDNATVKPYALLLRAMKEADKVGIARFVMRGKEYLCAIRPQDDKLVLNTMLYADEVRDASEIPELEDVAGASVSDKEVEMAAQLIASLDAEFDPDEFHDTYREKVMDLIERKAAGDESTVEAPAPVESNKVIDLMAALEASVKAAKEARGRHPSSSDRDDEEKSGGKGSSGSKAAEAPARKTAKKATKATKKASKSTAKPAAKKASRARKSA
jgi:DNA end-binding protein Ku